MPKSYAMEHMEHGPEVKNPACGGSGRWRALAGLQAGWQ